MRLRLNGRRGWGLLALAVLVALPRGLSYLPPLSATDAPRAVQLMSQWVPYETWGVVWLLAAVVGIVCAFRVEGRSLEHALDRDAFAFATLIALTGAWGLAYSASAVITLVTGEQSREWVLAGTFLGFGFAMWALVAPRPTTPLIPLSDDEADARTAELAAREVDDDA